jgi:hypothetical protein
VSETNPSPPHIGDCQDESMGFGARNNPNCMAEENEVHPLGSGTGSLLRFEGVWLCFVTPQITA